MGGIEPPLTDSKSGVMPLDHTSTTCVFCEDRTHDLDRVKVTRYQLRQKDQMRETGFEPALPKEPVPETGALTTRPPAHKLNHGSFELPASRVSSGRSTTDLMVHNVESTRIELVTSSMLKMRAANCANSPRIVPSNRIELFTLAL
jgi:hypothetical protein